MQIDQIIEALKAADPCMAEKMDELKKAHPEMPHKQMVAVAMDKCGEDKPDKDEKAIPVESSLGDGDEDVAILDDDTPTQPIPPKPAVDGKSFGKRLTEFVQSLRPVKTNFKVAGDHWFITWSNNFEDREGEIFTQKAIDAYVRRVDMGIVPLPELWIWHAGKDYRIGEAELVGRHGHFVIAVGTFDKTTQGERAKAYYGKHQTDTGVSHGFTYPEKAFDGRHYHVFNTFEISLLPRSAAANPYTSLDRIREDMKMLSEQKKAYIQQVFGAEDAERTLKALDSLGTEREALGEAFKDFTATDEPGMTQAVSGEAVKAVETSLKELVADLAEGQSEVFKALPDVLARVKEQDKTIAALTAQVKEATEWMASIKADLPRTASKAAETIVDPEGLPEAMRNSMRQLDPALTKFFGVEVETSLT